MTEEEAWIDVYSVGALYGTKQPKSYLPKLLQIVESLAGSDEWQRWWAATKLPRLEIHVHLGTQQGYRRGDVKFRRNRRGLRAEICSVASQADFKAMDSTVLVARDLDHLLEACQAHYKIELPHPSNILSSGQTTPSRSLPVAAEQRIFEDSSSRTSFLELHIPLVAATDVDADAYQFPWILDVETYLEELETTGRLQVMDDGEEVDDEYLFFVTGRPDNDLIQIAADIATRPGIPGGGVCGVETVKTPISELVRRWI